MYIVSMQNGTTTTEIQNEHHKLLSGSVVKSINTIDSFTFSILPDNPAFGKLKDFTTLISVYNLARRRYEFYGRVLYTSPQMSDKGLITQEAICESYFGFMCDSQQEYVAEKNWTVGGLLQHILDCHNAQVEKYKRFQIGQLGVEDPNDNLYIGIQRENTWETIKKKLIDVLGGELRFRVEGGVNYLDYVESIGEMKETEIALSKNMKSIVKEKNPSSFITRLIPLGAKLDDDSEERLGIAEVNDGKNYIEDAAAIAEYGIHVGYVEFDDVTDANNLLNKGREWLENNNKVSIKYSITALDLSLIGLDVDDFDVGNTHPLKNSLLGIDDTGRINKKNIDVCDETKTSFEIGESFKTLSELQREQMVSVGRVSNDVAEIRRNYATNKKLNDEITRTVSRIDQTEKNIVLAISGETVSMDDYNSFQEALSAAISIDTDSILQTVSKTYAPRAELPGRNILKGTQEATITGSAQEKFVLTTPLTKGITYHFSADVEVLAGSATQVHLGYLVPNNGVDANKILAFNIPIIDGHVAATFEPGADVDASYYCFVATNGDTACQVKIANIKLEKGNTETEWSLAPEELATQESVQEVSGKLELKINKTDLVSELNASADVINITSNRLSIESDKFTLTPDGAITCSDVNITGGKIEIPGLSGDWRCSTIIDNGDVLVTADDGRLSLKLYYGGLKYDTTDDKKYRNILTNLDDLTLQWPEVRLHTTYVGTWDVRNQAKRRGLTGLVDKSDYMLFVNGLLVGVGTSDTVSPYSDVWLHDVNFQS